MAQHVLAEPKITLGDNTRGRGGMEGEREKERESVEKKGLGALRLLASSAADPLQAECRAIRVRIRRFYFLVGVTCTDVAFCTS